MVNDQSNAYYDVGNEIIYNAESVESNHCDCSDACILVGDDIITTAHKNPTPVAFKNSRPFIKCITKIDGTTIDDAVDLDSVMLNYNLIEYSSNYSDPAGSLWFYSKEKATTFNVDIANNNNFKSFSYKVELLKNAFADGAKFNSKKCNNRCTIQICK